MEDSSFIPGTSNVLAMEVLKHSRITEASCSTTHGQIQLQFLVKRSGYGGREEELAGEWAGYRSRMLLAYTSHRDGRVWEPGPWPAACQPDSSVSHGHFSCQTSCHYCWFSQLSFQCACPVRYRILIYVCVLKYHSHVWRIHLKSCWVSRQYLKRSFFEWVKVYILFLPRRDINPQGKMQFFSLSYI